MAGVEGDDAGAVLDHIVTQFNTYEEYLDSQITTQDLFYLENEEMARQLVELGFRGSGEVLKREDFIARKIAAEASRISERQQQKILSSAGKELKDNFLKALAEREEANRNGKMSDLPFFSSNVEEIGNGFLERICPLTYYSVNSWAEFYNTMISVPWLVFHSDEREQV